ncbi:MAG: serine/threonine protein kinase [Candidatus Obscuribacterales bacterium]|nr:serine/threonine protein kinase [Candidatus Obscuribacterales bacterium]
MTQPPDDDPARIDSSSTDVQAGTPPDQVLPPHTEDFSPQSREDELSADPPAQADVAPVLPKPVKPPDLVKQPDITKKESVPHQKPARTAENLTPGQVWAGKFQIEGLLGSGGMGKVFKALHLQISAPVALKVMDAAVGTDKGTSRFMREARLLSAVNHANVVRLLAFGQTAEHVLYMALEFVSGHSLAEVLAQQIIDPTRAVVIAQQLCNGLTAAHNAGIIHRDLKPSNILLTQDERGFEVVKIIDFGIARLADDLERTAGEVESTSSVVGTPHYMSPEQCTGKKLDFRSDIYSVGCILYEMLCGQPPFPSEVPYTVMQGHINERLENVPAKHSVPLTLESLVLKCLEKEPSARFARAEDLATALSKINWDTVNMVSQVKRDTQPGKSANNKIFLAMVALLIVIPTASYLIFQRLSENVDKVLRPEQRRTALRSINLSSDQRQIIQRLIPSERVKWYRDWLSKYADKPDSCEAYFFLAQDLSESEGNPAEIAATFSEAAKKFGEQIELILERPENERKYNDYVGFAMNRANCLQRINKPADALKGLMDNIKQLEDTKCPKTKQAELYNAAARLYSQGGDHQKAEECANTAEKMIISEGMRGQPLSDVRLAHATYLFEAGQRDAALVKIGQADIERASDDANAKKYNSQTDFTWPLSVATTYSLMHSYDLALQKFNQAEAMIPPGFRTMELTSGKLRAQLKLERWDDARDTLTKALSQQGAKLDAADTWSLLFHLCELNASGNTKIDIEPIVRRELGRETDNPAMLAQMIYSGTALLHSRNKELAGEVLERSLDLYRNTLLTKQTALTDGQQTLAVKMCQGLICAGKFESVESFARQIYQLYPASLPLNRKPSQLLRIFGLHAVAMSYSGKRREAAHHIKSAVDMLTREYPNSVLQVEALLDRAVVQRNLRLEDNVWLRWATEAANKGALQVQARESLFDRVFCALCNRDPLFADQLTESGQQMFEGNPSAKCVFDLECSSRYFFAGRYDRASDLIFSGLAGLKYITPADQRRVLQYGIIACDRAGATEKCAKLKQILEETPAVP